MAKLSTDLRTSVLHPRENLFGTGALASATNGAAVNADGCGSFILNLNGTFTGTARVEGFDGVVWTPIQMKPVNVASTTLVVSATAPGTWVGTNPGYTQTRVNCTAYTSGTINYYLTNSLELPTPYHTGMGIIQSGTVTAATGVAATLTIPAPGAGLRHYLTSIRIERHTSTLLTAGATPTIVTTTNIPTSLAFSIPADAAAQGAVYAMVETYGGLGLATAAQNTATTIVAPLTTGVIWRITAYYYVAP